MPDDLPSVRFERDDPRPKGFVEEVSEAHLQAAGGALKALADAFQVVSADSEPHLRVRLTSVRYMPTLPFVLYAFHLMQVDDAGQIVDETDSGGDITYALVANQAVEVQRESALLFLYQLVSRQAAIARMRSARNPEIHTIDTVTMEADQRAKQEFQDRIATGWQNAARSIAQQALACGQTLAIRYEVDPLPTRLDVVRRMPALRSAYNDIPLARDTVDKKVSLVGGHDPRLRGGSLTQGEMNQVQRHIASLGIRQWVSQTLRDADVCGNGYLVGGGASLPAMYNLRPEDVEIIGPEDFRVLRDGASERVQGHVSHLVGIAQFESPYGISMLEPVLAEHRTRRIFLDVSQFAEKVIAERPPESGEVTWARRALELASRSLAASDERLDRLLWYPREWLPDAREGLYFPGQERM